MEDVIKKYERKFGKKSVTWKTLFDYVAKIGKDVEEKKSMYNEIKTKYPVLPEPDSFSVVPFNNRFRITSVKFGVISIYSVDTEEDVKTEKEKWENKTLPVVEIEEHKPQGEKPVKRVVNIVDEFYNKLEENDYYIVEDFTLKLYDGASNDQIYMLTQKDEKIVKKAEIELAKFYLVDKEYDLSEHPLVADYWLKDIGDGYYILLVLPNLHFRDKRVGFSTPRFGKSMKLREVRESWNDVMNYGYERTQVNIIDIPDTITEKNKNIAKEYVKNKKEKIKSVKKIMKMKATKILPQDIKYEIKGKAHNSKNVNKSVEVRAHNKIDNKIQREKVHEMINKEYGNRVTSTFNIADIVKVIKQK